jgi:hypothetical protein
VLGIFLSCRPPFSQLPLNITFQHVTFSYLSCSTTSVPVHKDMEAPVFSIMAKFSQFGHT